MTTHQTRTWGACFTLFCATAALSVPAQAQDASALVPLGLSLCAVEDDGGAGITWPDGDIGDGQTQRSLRIAHGSRLVARSPRRSTTRHYGRSGRYSGRSVHRSTSRSRSATRHYGRSGRYQGRSVHRATNRRASTTRHYGRSGRYTGRSSVRKSGSRTTVRHYDRSGRYRGKTTVSGSRRHPKVRHYNRAGRYRGRSRR